MSSAGIPVIADHCLGWELLDALPQLGKARGVALDVVRGRSALVDDDVHHAEGERAIGAGRIGMCQSARWAVRVRTGSIRPPWRRASGPRPRTARDAGWC